MTISELIDAIHGRAPKQKDFTAAVEILDTSWPLRSFVESNQILLSGVTPSAVADQLLLMANQFLDARVGPTIAKNVYDEYSVMFLLAALGATNAKSERNSLMKLMRATLSNTSKFDMYVRRGSRNMHVSSKGYVIELFWLLPLFVNVPVMLSIDAEDFIAECEEIKAFDPLYAEGYASFATGDILGLDKGAFKLFMQEGAVALAHSKSVAA